MFLQTYVHSITLRIVGVKVPAILVESSVAEPLRIAQGSAVRGAPPRSL